MKASSQIQLVAPKSHPTTTSEIQNAAAALGLEDARRGSEGSGVGEDTSKL
jgi:hypothetical protein